MNVKFKIENVKDEDVLQFYILHFTLFPIMLHSQTLYILHYP